ncbi:MAG: RNA helicase [Bacilli bacterium]|nr:RNA helicase [Bacilli bacterium]
MDTRSGQIIEKEILVLSLDFIFGPISKDYQDDEGNEITGINVVDQDDICNKLDKEINELYSSLWIPNENEASGYSFDEEKEKELAPKILELLKRLIARLNDINDGSFEIDDMVTGHYVDLLKK